jgi:hypothetical protein
MDRRARYLSVMLLPLLATVFSAVLAAAQDVRRYIYAAVPGVSNDEQFGGVGILVFDADNGHKFVRRIPTWETYRREAIEPIKGIAAHAGTSRLYVSTTRRLAAFDLATDKIVWQKGYDADCWIAWRFRLTARRSTCRPSSARNGTWSMPPTAT